MSKRCTVYAAGFLIWVASALGAVTASADPIQVGGGIMPSTLGTGNYQWYTTFLGGARFYADIPRPLTPAEQICTPCAPGQALDLSTTIMFATRGEWHPSPFEIGREAYAEGQLTFQTAPLSVPPGLVYQDLIGIRFPLTATGFLRFTDLHTSEVLFENQVFGAGTGLLWLTGPRDAAPYSFRFVNYSLDEPKLVPEPSSMLLAGSGIWWLARRVRTRRRTRA